MKSLIHTFIVASTVILIPGCTNTYSDKIVGITPFVLPPGSEGNWQVVSRDSVDDFTVSQVSKDSLGGKMIGQNDPHDTKIVFREIDDFLVLNAIDDENKPIRILWLIGKQLHDGSYIFWAPDDDAFGALVKEHRLQGTFTGSQGRELLLSDTEPHLIALVADALKNNLFDWSKPYVLRKKP